MDPTPAPLRRSHSFLELVGLGCLGCAGLVLVGVVGWLTLLILTTLYYAVRIHA